MFDAIKFFADHRIKTWPENSKNVPAGAIGTRCPFCGDRSNHLHFWIDSGAASCWRCGKHSNLKIVSALLRCDLPNAEGILRKYYKRRIPVTVQYEERNIPQQLKMPSGVGPLMDAHKKYLSTRNFDWCEISDVWKVQGTNHLDKDYRWRIIAPVFDKGNMVSYQGRDITGQQKQRYMACKPENEIVSHKKVLYGSDLAVGDTVVVVEGITDAWRLGPGAVATFGSEWTHAQAFSLSIYWEKVILFFDNDEAGRKAARKLHMYLQSLGRNVEDICLEECPDPGSLKQSDANYLMNKVWRIR